MLNQSIKNRSQVIRIAIENFISENLEEQSSRKLVVRIPIISANKLLDCISAGDVLNFPSAVQIALDRYIDSIEDFYLTKRKQILDARIEYQKEMAKRIEANDSIKR